MHFFLTLDEDGNVGYSPFEDRDKMSSVTSTLRAVRHALRSELIGHGPDHHHRPADKDVLLVKSSTSSLDLDGR